MRILIVKTSSLGDLIHTFPALTDAAIAHPGLHCDWLVEESFIEVPTWHPSVTTAIPIALRRWQRQLFRACISGDIRMYLRQLRQQRYDVVLDAQGLLKSAMLAALARGTTSGFDRYTVREPLASMSYQRVHSVPRSLHAIKRLRCLFAAALDYSIPETPINYGLVRPVQSASTRPPYLIFLPATTWPSKHWPQNYWAILARQADSNGYQVRWAWHTSAERNLMQTLIQSGGGELLPPLTLGALAIELANAAGVVGVDTGLAHLTAALGTPAITLYGPTNTALTGAIGEQQRNLQAVFPCVPCRRRVCNAVDHTQAMRTPCFTSLTPAKVWLELQQLLHQ